MRGTLQTGLKYENVKWSSGCVCSLQFKFEWQEGLTAVGDLQKRFCHYNNNIIVQPYIEKHEAAFYTTLWCAS